MSVRVMAQVWEESPRKGGELIVLLALADWANDDGISWPSIARLASRARMSERSVQKILQRLREGGDIQVQHGGYVSGKNTTNTYRVMGRTSDGGRTFDTPSEVHHRGEPQAAPVVKAEGTTIEPSVEPPIEPSTALAAEAAAGDHLPGMEPPAPPPDQTDAKVVKIWQHYLEVFGERVRVKDLTDRRAGDIRKALKATADDVELCCRAIDGLQSYRATHPQGSQDVAISVPFSTHPGSRSNLTDQIEWWASQADPATRDGKLKVPLDLTGVPSVQRGTILNRRSFVKTMIERGDDATDYERSKGTEALDWLRDTCGHEPIVEDGRLRGWRAVTA